MRSPMKFYHPMAPVLAVFALSACAPTSLPPEEAKHHAAALYLKEASSPTMTAEKRAVNYLNSAKESASLLDSSSSSEDARLLYNTAVADLTILLRSADNGALWNRPLTLNAGGTNYRLRFAKGTRDGLWDPAYFTSFTPAEEVDLKTIDRRNRQDGVGGALVGVRKTAPLEAFSPLVGITAPVTASLEFKGNEAVLTLVDPTLKTKSRIAGKDRSLEADYSAPLAYYPQKNELVEGFMGALRVSDYMNITGLYSVEPYDPDRIPLVFVHGLISTPRMWRNVINEVETDPELRRRYQCMVFAYPTGNPPLYSALRLREELGKFYAAHPGAKDAVLVGHSMGGILSRAQVTSVDREDWNAIGEKKASTFFAKVKPGDLIDRATCFEANPHVGRSVFICTPHRGSKLAVGTVGELAMRLIALPVDITSTVTGAMGDSLAVVTGDSKRVPNSVSGLSPSNPTYKVLENQPVEVPHHSIIGDRGKGDTPQSSDGVVEYWSSQMKAAESEKIVPGPHGSCELPETIAELRRILHLHLSQD